MTQKLAVRTIHRAAQSPRRRISDRTRGSRGSHRRRRQYWGGTARLPHNARQLNAKPASWRALTFMAGVEGFEPPNGGIKTRDRNQHNQQVAEATDRLVPLHTLQLPIAATSDRGNGGRTWPGSRHDELSSAARKPEVPCGGERQLSGSPNRLRSSLSCRKKIKFAAGSHAVSRPTTAVRLGRL